MLRKDITCTAWIYFQVVSYATFVRRRQNPRNLSNVSVEATDASQGI